MKNGFDGWILQAVLYFQRALKQDRRFLNAWTLMGHEYVEMKNPPAAIGAPLAPLLSFLPWMIKKMNAYSLHQPTLNFTQGTAELYQARLPSLGATSEHACSIHRRIVSSSLSASFAIEMVLIPPWRRS